MKTPRQVLLDHAARIQPQLDRQRQAWVQQLSPPGVHDASRFIAPRCSWRILTQGLQRAAQELFWIPRRAWFGLATVWILLLCLNWGDRSERASIPTAARLPWAQVVRLWQDQYRLASEEPVRGPVLKGFQTPMILTPQSRRLISVQAIEV